MYHSYRLCIAPTGSIYVQSATASVMPIMERIEERTYGNSKTPLQCQVFQQTGSSIKKYDMDMFKVVDKDRNDSAKTSIKESATPFPKDTMTTRDLNRIDLYGTP
ncbi:hypothetical protein ACEQPO_14375 [Bacillus sp. SL00103]